MLWVANGQDYRRFCLEGQTTALKIIGTQLCERKLASWNINFLHKWVG